MKAVIVSLWVLALATTLRAGHHEHDTVSVAAPRCGWIEGANVRDISNVSEFCAHWVPSGFQIPTVTATRERLWIETPPGLAASLRSDDRTTRELLADWLTRWRTITGYRTASVTLLRRHVEIAKAETTMSGDSISVR
jgi:hypothetical protein